MRARYVLFFLTHEFKQNNCSLFKLNKVLKNHIIHKKNLKKLIKYFNLLNIYIILGLFNNKKITIQ